MRATWRPLPAWPYEARPKRPKSFEASWAKTISDLERELELVEAKDVLIGLVAGEDQFTITGNPRPGFKVRHNGAELSFDAPGRGRLVFHTDAFGSFGENLRAISLGLSALRAIERYGITTTAEQYAGFAALTAGGPDPARGQLLVERAGGIRQALMAHHPDQGGEARDLADVVAYREKVGA